MSTTEIATNKKTSIKEHLNSEAFKQEVARVLPKHITPDRMVRTGLTAMIRTPELAKCTPESVLQCMMQLSQWGLEPDGRHAHLIPYGTTCTLVLDYKGIVDLVLRGGSVRTIHADVVFDGDLFEYSLGEVKQHTPHFLRTDAGKPESAGKVIAAYCHVTFLDGVTKSEVMSTEEIEKVRRSSKAGQSGPWKDWWSEMAKKTVFKRASKWLKLSAEVREAIDRDHDQPERISNTEPQRLRLVEGFAVPSVVESEPQE